MKVLLTGATGFLGSNLLRRLLRDRHEVIILKRSSSNLKRILEEAKTLRTYDADKDSFPEIFRNNAIDIIIHCATNYGRDDSSPTQIIEANLILPLQLVQLGAKNGVKAFINSDTILDKQVSHYSLSKNQFSEWLSYFAPNLSCMNVALEHFYGPFDDPSKFVTFIIQSLLKEVNELNLTPGQQKRDFIFIDDVIEAYLKVIEFAVNSKNGFHKFEVGTNKNLEIKSFIELAAKLAQNTTTRLNFGALPYRKNEVMESSANTALLRSMGWKSQIELEDGLRRTITEERKVLGLNAK